MPSLHAQSSGSKNRGRPEEVLLVAYYERHGVPSIVESIDFLQAHSEFWVSVLNLAEHRADGGFLKFPRNLDLNSYDAVVIHNTVSYNVDNLRSLDAVTALKLRDFQGAKIAMKQDEHLRFKEFAQYAVEAGIDAVMSVMPESEIPKTYGRLLPGVDVRPMLTGYVTPSMRGRFSRSTARSIDIGYRGSIMPLSFGRLCYQKRRIGEVVKERLARHGLELDISSRWEDRLGGEAWFGFLGSCKSVLGVESGTGTFDLDGTLEATCRTIETTLGRDDGSPEYAERYLSQLSAYEGKVDYRTISPRHFESIAMGAVQILLPGRYSDRMVAGSHYFELEDGLSNLEEAVDLVRDPARRDVLAVAAFEEVLRDQRNGIESLVETVDDVVARVLKRKNRTRHAAFQAPIAAHNIVVMQCHSYGLDPRRDGWYSAGAPRDVRVHQVGISRTSSRRRLLAGPNGGIVLELPRRLWAAGCLDHYASRTGHDAGASLALRELHFLDRALGLSGAELFCLYGVPSNEEVVRGFRDYLRYLLDSAATLVPAIAESRGVHVLVPINFPSLLPAIILRGVIGAPVVYEALEYWPEADPDHGEAFQSFWFDMERRLLPFTDHRGTVSPPLARLMSDAFALPFYAVPNCPPRGEGQLQRVRCDRETEPGRVRFLYQGRFSPHRGLEQLIRAWRKVDSRAQLLLRGPTSEFRDEMIRLAKSFQFTSDQVCFLEAVAIGRLVEVASTDADVGVIPYSPAGTNYSNCSPNKLGQYLAAGLPILANRTNFVEGVIGSANCGVVTDFQRETGIVEAVGRLCDLEYRSACARNSRAHFDLAFNWEAVSRPFYNAIDRSIGRADACNLVFFDDRNCANVVGSATPHLIETRRALVYMRTAARAVWRALPALIRRRLRGPARAIQSMRWFRWVG